jgi:hypothetical protein
MDQKSPRKVTYCSSAEQHLETGPLYHHRAPRCWYVGLCACRWSRSHGPGRCYAAASAWAHRLVTAGPGDACSWVMQSKSISIHKLSSLNWSIRLLDHSGLTAYNVAAGTTLDSSALIHAQCSTSASTKHHCIMLYMPCILPLTHRAPHSSHTDCLTTFFTTTQ